MQRSSPTDAHRGGPPPPSADPGYPGRAGGTLSRQRCSRRTRGIVVILEPVPQHRPALPAGVQANTGSQQEGEAKHSHSDRNGDPGGAHWPPAPPVRAPLPYGRGTANSTHIASSVTSDGGSARVQPPQAQQ